MGEIVEAQFQYLKQSIIELEAQITHPLITCMIDKCKEIMRLQESLGVGFGFPGPKDFIIILKIFHVIANISYKR